MFHQGQGASETGKGYKIFYSGVSSKVGVNLDPEMKEADKDVARHSDQLTLLKLVLQREIFYVIPVYAPQMGS